MGLIPQILMDGSVGSIWEREWEKNIIQQWADTYCFEFHEASKTGKLVVLDKLNRKMPPLSRKSTASAITPLGDKVRWDERFSKWIINEKVTKWEFQT